MNVPWFLAPVVLALFGAFNVWQATDVPPLVTLDVKLGFANPRAEVQRLQELSDEIEGAKQKFDKTAKSEQAEVELVKLTPFLEEQLCLLQGIGPSSNYLQTNTLDAYYKRLEALQKGPREQYLQTLHQHAEQCRQTIEQLGQTAAALKPRFQDKLQQWRRQSAALLRRYQWLHGLLGAAMIVAAAYLARTERSRKAKPSGGQIESI